LKDLLVVEIESLFKIYVDYIFFYPPNHLEK